MLGPVGVHGKRRSSVQRAASSPGSSTSTMYAMSSGLRPPPHPLGSGRLARRLSAAQPNPKQHFSCSHLRLQRCRSVRRASDYRAQTRTFAGRVFAWAWALYTRLEVKGVSCSHRQRGGRAHHHRRELLVAISRQKQRPAALELRILLAVLVQIRAGPLHVPLASNQQHTGATQQQVHAQPASARLFARGWGWGQVVSGGLGHNHLG